MPNQDQQIPSPLFHRDNGRNQLLAQYQQQQMFEM